MNERIENEKQVRKFCRKYVFFASFTDDLVFLAIVDTLFLSIVKGLSASQIALLTPISSIISILLQPYLLKIIHKVGNTKSMRLGALSMLIASLLITFGNQFAVLVLGRAFREIAYVFLNMENICLKNNLNYVHKEDEYILIRNKVTLFYALITAVISVISGFLFNANGYLPMILNCILCFACFGLSFTMRDMTKYDIIGEQEIQKAKGKPSIIVYVAILSYTFFYTAVTIGQANSKLFIQYQLNDVLDTAATATYFSLIITLSRFVRIVSNALFDKMYRKLKDKINIALAAGLIMAFVLIIVGAGITENVVARISTMACGFFLILAVRDPFKIYIQDLILRVTKEEEQQAIFANLELAKKMGQTLIGFVVSSALLKFDMIWIIVGSLVISLMALRATIRLFELVQRSSKPSTSQKAIEKFITLEKSHRMKKEGMM